MVIAAAQWLILAALGVVLAGWIARAVLIRSAVGAGPPLDHNSYRDLGDVGLVSVIVPAKDEEENIGPALATILAQDYPRLEVIVVDDRSTDRTGQIARDVAARDDRVRVVRVESLPEGWSGRTHALLTGTLAARGEWLLFVDADCRQAPHGVRAGVGLLAEQGADLLSLWPVLEMDSFCIRAIQPVAGAILATWFRPSRVNSPRSKVAFANGQYILVRRAAFEAAGGWEAVREELNDDIAFARKVKAAGRRVVSVVKHDLFTARMYDTLGAMYRGWSRLYYGAFRSVWWLSAVVGMILLFSLGPVAAVIGAGVAMAAGAGGGWTLAVLGLGAAGWAAMLVTLYRGYVLTRHNPWYITLYPVAILPVLVFLGGAMAKAAGLSTVTWRGMTYRRGKAVRPAAGPARPVDREGT
jgi:glycosyltransferase involved in cell wall biosynthesis